MTNVHDFLKEPNYGFYFRLTSLKASADIDGNVSVKWDGDIFPPTGPGQFEQTFNEREVLANLPLLTKRLNNTTTAARLYLIRYNRGFSYRSTELLVAEKDGPPPVFSDKRLLTALRKPLEVTY